MPAAVEAYADTSVAIACYFVYFHHIQLAFRMML